MPTKASTTPKKADSAKDAPAKKVNPALMKPLQPSKELAAVVGSEPLPRPEVVSKVWDYIKKHNLQDPANKREIRADEKLQAVFGKERVTMFEMNKHLAQHLTQKEPSRSANWSSGFGLPLPADPWQAALPLFTSPQARRSSLALAPATHNSEGPCLPAPSRTAGSLWRAIKRAEDQGCHWLHSGGPFHLPRGQDR